MAKYYAWSNFNVDIVEGKAKTSVKPGDEVTAAKLKVSEEEFKEMIDAGSVRTQEYPDTGGDSPVNYYYKQARQLTANATSDE